MTLKGCSLGISHGGAFLVGAFCTSLTGRCRAGCEV